MCMFKYDQLLLEFGGGVINAYSQSEAYKRVINLRILKKERDI